MKQWLRKQLIAAEYDTGAAIDRAMAARDELDPIEHELVDRAGLGRLITDVAKASRLHIPKNGGPAESMPLFAAVEQDGRWLRVSYLRANFDQLSALYERERKSAKRQTNRVARLRHDVQLYRQHRDMPTLQDVWAAEHVEFRLDVAA